MAAQRAVQAVPHLGGEAQVGQTLHAEGVVAAQEFGGTERIVVGIPAHRTLRFRIRFGSVRHVYCWFYSDCDQPESKGKTYVE